MSPAHHARRRHARLQNREPGLINLPLPIPSIPVLSPVITPLVGSSSNPKHASQPAPPPLQSLPLPSLQPPPPPQSTPPTSPQPSPPPPPPPPQQSPTSSPPPSNPNKGGNGGGSAGAGNGNGGNNGNGGGNSGNGGGNSGNSGNSGNDGGSGPPPSSSGGNSNPNPGSSLQIQPSLGSSSNSAISSSPSGISIASVSNGSSSLVSGKAAGGSSTGAVFALNNEAMPTSASSGTPSDAIDASGVREASTPSITSGSSLDSPDSSSGSSGSPSAGNGNNGNGTVPGTGTSSPGTNNASSASHSQLSAGAIVGIIIAIFIVLGLLAFYIIRKRHLHRKAERRVRWINGVTGESPDMQETQRCISMRSSWGTPVEHRFSDPFQYSMGNSGPNTQETDDAHLPYSYNFSDVVPVLPMPVHSPIDDRSYVIENPFADRSTSPQPIRQMSSLPIRISLISEGSGNADPFDDAQGGYVVDDHIAETGIVSGGIAHGSARDSGHGTQANFPLPPPSASSAATVFAIGSPSQLLEPPGILISFPDSPISPTFAATGTSSYPRRASVKMPFHPSQDRRDEVHLEKDDQVTVVSVYEDGWAFIQNERTSERGLVPLDCLEIDNP